MSLQNDLTTGNIRTQILKFAFPLIISNFFQALYNAVDMFFVGRYTGTIGLSAVSVCGPIMNIMIMTISGLSVGGGKPKRATKALKEAIKLAICIAVIIAIIILIFSHQFVSIFNKDSEVINATVDYLKIAAISYIIYAIIHPFIGFIRGSGNAIQTLINVAFSQYIIRIPVAILCTHLFGFSGVPMAVVSSPTFSLFMYGYFIISGRWKKSRDYQDMLAENGKINLE